MSFGSRGKREVHERPLAGYTLDCPQPAVGERRVTPHCSDDIRRIAAFSSAQEQSFNVGASRLAELQVVGTLFFTPQRRVSHFKTQSGLNTARASGFEQILGD